MPVPAAAPAAAGLRVRVEPPQATVSFDRIDPLGVPETGEAFATLRRRLTGDVRVVVLQGRDWSAGLARPPAPAAPNPNHVPGREPPPGVVPPGGGASLATRAGARPRGDAPISTHRVPSPGWPATFPLGERQLEAVQAGVDWLSGQADLISVAVLRGTAEGFGLDLALAADLRIACEGAVLRWAPAGSYPPALFGGHDTLLGLVGYPRALEWRVAGHQLSATEAMAAGIVSRVAPPGRLDGTVAAFVAGLLAAPRDAVAETKALLLAARDRRGSRVAALRDERDAFLRLG